MLDEEHISMLKPSAIVINVARGAVTDEAALAKALMEDRIGGLGVDVYSTEPMPDDHPFAKILKSLFTISTKKDLRTAILSSAQ